MTYIRAQTKDGKVLADFLMDVMHGKRIPSGMGKRGHTPNLKDRIEATKVLLARGWGTIPAVENDDFPSTLIVRVSDRDWADLHGLPWKGGSDET